MHLWREDGQDGMWLCSCTQCKKHSAELSGKRPPTRPGSQPATWRDLGWKLCRGVPGTSALRPAWQCPSPNTVSHGWHCSPRGGACGDPEAPYGKSTWWLCRPHDSSMGDPAALARNRELVSWPLGRGWNLPMNSETHLLTGLQGLDKPRCLVRQILLYCFEGKKVNSFHCISLGGKK